MANNPSAEKANRQSIKRRTRNRAAMSALRTAVKKARAAIDGKAAEANDLRKSAISIIDKAVFRSERGTGPGYFITVMVCEIVFGVLASIIVMWFSRRREFRADQGGASLAGRRNMIAALERLNAQHPQPLPEKMAAFGIAGGVGSGLKRLFMTHPPLEERIAALKAAEQ